MAISFLTKELARNEGCPARRKVLDSRLDINLLGLGKGLKGGQTSQPFEDKTPTRGLKSTSTLESVEKSWSRTDSRIEQS